jgi:WD40 repeat protein
MTVHFMAGGSGPGRWMSEPGYRLSLTPDERRALSVFRIRINDPSIAHEENLYRFESKEDGHGICLTISPDGRHVLTGSRQGKLRLWEAGKEVWHDEAHQGAILSVAFSQDGRQFLSVGQDGIVRVWNLAGLQEQRQLELPAQGITCADFSRDRQRLLWGCEDGSVRLWDLGRGELRRYQGHRAKVTTVRFSPDGRQALSGSEDRTVRLWDLDSGRQLLVYRGHTDSVYSVAFSPEGQTALSGGRDGTVRVWRLPE